MRSRPLRSFSSFTLGCALFVALTGSAGTAQQVCPANIVTPPSAACAKPLTGCLCSATYGGTANGIPGCEGCVFAGTVTQSCTNPSNTTSYDVGGIIECGHRQGLSIDCQCGDAEALWTPVVITCGSCQ